LLKGNAVTSKLVLEQLERLPTSPGVYLMKDATGTIIYVGKAAILKNRVRSYFAPGENLTPKIARMVGRVESLDFFVTGSEQEALILEMNLIKRHRPHYNVRLKDDKSFPYLKISLNEEWPRVYVPRRLVDDGGRYFGPFASAKSVRQTLKVLKEVFPFRSCTKPITGTDARACLDYHIQRCLAPCVGAVSREEYNRVIRQIILFLEGKQERVIRDMEKRMEAASTALEFERAALLRDRLQALKNVVEAQKIASAVRGELDAIAFAQDKSQAYVQVFFVRGGKLVGRESFVLEGTQSESPSEIMASFIKQFYSSATQTPPLILLQHPAEDEATIREWLTSKRGGGVRLLVPQRGARKELVSIVAENARQGMEQQRIKNFAAPEVAEAALSELEQALGLSRAPARIEGYDISNIQGKMAVGSMVVFENGKPKPAHYRRFKIKTVPGVDDYAMLHEVLSRRFKRISDEAVTWAIVPDLVLIDGGKGQLSAAMSALASLGVSQVPLASLAKENEEVFIPYEPNPVVLPRSSPGLQILQRVRDEAHRFALGYHLKRRSREAVASALDGVPGIGPKRRRALLKQFGSVKAIREAPETELAAASGMNPKLARKLKEYL
jgi:excinuclease ABC subunit C